MLTPEPLAYPAREHYDVPSLPSERLAEEYRLYPDRHDTMRMLIGLRNMYQASPFMQSMRKYSEFAAAAKYEQGDVATRPPLNNEFYAGTLLSLHATISIMPTFSTHHVLSHDFLSDLRVSPGKSDVESDITDWLDMWLGHEQYNWLEYFSGKGEAYQRLATQFAERLYPNSDEDQLDFMGGFAFGTNMIEQTTMPAGPPV